MATELALTSETTARQRATEQALTSETTARQRATELALTSETITLTKKKMDMTLDDIIKMSNETSNRAKNRRGFNKTQGFSNGLGYKRNAKMQHFFDSRSSIRQGVLAQRRSNFRGAQFQSENEAAKKAVVTPIRNRSLIRNRGANWNTPRVAVAAVRKNTVGSGFVSGKAKMGMPPKQRPQTLDSLFASMKEQRMQVQQMPGGQNTRQGRLQQQRGARTNRVQQMHGGQNARQGRLLQQRGARTNRVQQMRVGQNTRRHDALQQQRGARTNWVQPMRGGLNTRRHYVLQQQRGARANGVQPMRGGQNTIQQGRQQQLRRQRGARGSSRIFAKY